MRERPLPGPNWLEPPSSGKASVDLGRSSISKGPTHSSFTTSGTHYPCVSAGSFSIPGANPLQVTCVLNACPLFPVTLPKAAHGIGFPSSCIVVKICFYFLLCVCLCVLWGQFYAYVNAGVHGVQKRASDCLEQQVVVSISVLVLGNTLRSSAIVRTCNS